MAERPRISLCMIVRNEASCLGRCLESAAHLADERILVDTGSTDETAQVAASFGCTVIHHPWSGDFAAARNRALEQAAGDWILWLDADETLSSEAQETIPRLVREADEGLSAYGLVVASWLGTKPGGHLSLVLQPRLFRNTPEHRFEGRIHEWVTVGPVHATDLRIYHDGYLTDPDRTRRKAARNIALLVEELQRHPGDPFTMAQLGAEYLRLGDGRQAVALLSAAWERERSYLYVDKLAQALLAQGAYTQVQQVAEAGLERWFDYSDLYYYLGAAALGLADWQVARSALSHCLALGPPPSRYRSIPAHTGFLAWYQLAQAEMGLHNWQNAVQACWQALTDRPDFADALSLLVEASIALLGSAEALAMLQAHLCLTDPVRTHLATAFAQRGAWREALHLLEQVTDLALGDKLLRADCLLALGQVATARLQLQLLDPAPPLWARWQSASCLAAWLAGDLPNAEQAIQALAGRRPTRPLADVLQAYHHALQGETVALHPTPRRLAHLLNLIEKLLVVGDQSGAERAASLMALPPGQAGAVGRLFARYRQPGALPLLERALAGRKQRKAPDGELLCDLAEALLVAGRTCAAAHAFERLRSDPAHRLQACLGKAEAALRAAEMLLPDPEARTVRSLAEVIGHERHRTQPVHDREE